MFQTRALITDISILAPGYYSVTALAPEIAAAAKPGQFIQIGITAPEANDPLLPKPISLCGSNETEGLIRFIFKTVGRGTRILGAKKKGELLNIRGPLGNGFTVAGAVRTVFLVAGGVGMPPLLFLAEYLTRTDPDKKITLFYGGRTRRDLLELNRWAALGAEAFPASDDGSAGFKGLITDLLSMKLKNVTPDYLAACGPQPMLKAAQGIAVAFGISGQLSLEAYMACGVGACLGCVCGTIHGYRRVCADGPVFPIDEVML